MLVSYRIRKSWDKMILLTFKTALNHKERNIARVKYDSCGTSGKKFDSCRTEPVN